VSVACTGVGLKPARVAAMREYIVAVKALLRGEETSYQGNEFKAVWDHLDPGLAPPVYVACSGPRVIKMAAQVADGIIPEMGYTPEDIAYVYSLVEEGCTEIGRDPKEIDIWWYSDVTFARDVETAMQSTIGTASHWLTMGSTKGKRIPEGYAPHHRGAERGFLRPRVRLQEPRLGTRNGRARERARDLRLARRSLGETLRHPRGCWQEAARIQRTGHGELVPVARRRGPR